MNHMREIGDRIEEFQQAGVQVVAISPWAAANTRESLKRYGDFPFPMLSDPEGKTARDYGLVDAAGNPLHGLFIVDTQRRVMYAQPTAYPFTDIDEVLAAGRRLSAKP